MAQNDQDDLPTEEQKTPGRFTGPGLVVPLLILAIIAGYLYILGRLKRFAKVSGEMVSLTAAEEALANSFPQFGLRFQVAVLSRPDEDRGEAFARLAKES